MSEYIKECIRYEVDSDGVALLTWDMAGRNANVMNADSMEAFDAAIDKVTADDDVVGAVMCSAKNSFIAGADLDMIEEIAFGEKDAEKLHEGSGDLAALIRKMETCGKPFAVAIEGAAMGGGLEISMGCHYRVMKNDPRVQVGLPESQLGLLPGAGGTQRMPRLIGIRASLPLLMEGKSVNAEKAKELGLVDELVDGDGAVAAAKKWILEEGDPVAPWDKKGFKIPGGGMDKPQNSQMFMGATAMFRKETKGNFPAGVAILGAVSEGLRVPIDVGLKIEARYMVSLLLDPTAGNMVRTFYLSMEKIKKLKGRPSYDDIPRSKVSKLGVLGAGTMGAGIAYSAAKAGIEVVLIDLEQDSAEKGKAYSAKIMDKKIKRGRATDEKKEELLSHITPTTDYSQLEGADLVVEAVFEDRGVKAKVSQQAEEHLDENAIIGSNTSTLPITGLAEAVEHQENFIGLHFFSPVDKMKLVEVIRGEKTSDETWARSLDFIQQIRKLPITVNDSRGFYTSRVFGNYINEGMGMLNDGVKPALIENAGSQSGMAMPPLTVADSVGLDLMLQVGEQTKQDLGDDYTPSPATPVLKVVSGEAGRHGVKNGKGFYEYHEDGSKKLWGELEEHFPPADEQPSVEELKKRFLYAQAVDAARCIEEGVIDNPAEMDVGAIMGIGFAPHTGGPMSYIDTVGVAEFVEEADRLAKEYGERFEPPQLLREMAEKGETIYGRFATL
jgi:3-hydroxyacyl-CoA dehydrogenase/enoyl-CoA hydratase/3-hydroxybutyryl-CoA epimerase